MSGSGIVLAIDDSPEVLAVLVARLRPEGIRVLTAQDWQKGIDLAVEHLPDLILLDVCMPEQSGLDICRRLKTDVRTEAIPVIFLTARDDVKTKVHGFDLGAADYITKPFHPDELRARVRAVIRGKRERDGLARKARVDALTGLWNRAAFDEELGKALDEAEQEGADASVILLDLDHFKLLNDRHGHSFGDLVLQRVGKVLLENVRPSDHACRYGGEELALILPDTSITAAAELAERIRKKLKALGLRSGASNVMVTASFGVASRRELLGVAHEVDAPAMIAAADEALYCAKREGRDCVRGESGVRRRPPTMRPSVIPGPAALPSAIPVSVSVPARRAS